VILPRLAMPRDFSTYWVKTLMSSSLPLGVGFVSKILPDMRWKQMWACRFCVVGGFD